MGMFSRLFWIFEKGKAHKDLEEAYSELNELAELLSRELQLLRDIQKEIIAARIKRTKYGQKATGAIVLSKTEFIEEEFLKKIRLLAKITETKFEENLKTTKRKQPVAHVEKLEIKRVIDFLEKIKSFLPSLDKIHVLSEREKLELIENALRNITALSREFHDIELRKKEMLIRIDEEAISPLLREIYLSPEQHPEEQSLLFYKVTSSQLRALEEESEKINNCNDPDYRIEWRRWWRDVQRPEKDKTTPLKDPHINVTIKLFGGSKKDIHLLLAA